MITPKEKSLRLCQQFGYTTLNEEFNNGYTISLEIAKKCALICVDEILKIEPIIKNLPLSETKIIMEAYPKFWEQVKTEIQNL